MNNKKNKILIVVIVMIVAVIMIIVGLAFLFKDKESTNEKTKVVTLSCNMTSTDNYNITIDTEYKNEKVDSIVMIYKPPVGEEITDMKTETAKRVLEYAALQGVTYSSVDNIYHIFLEERAYNANKDNEVITNMFLGYDELKNYYEEIGYTCK